MFLPSPPDLAANSITRDVSVAFWSKTECWGLILLNALHAAVLQSWTSGNRSWHWSIPSFVLSFAHSFIPPTCTDLEQ